MVRYRLIQNWSENSKCRKNRSCSGNFSSFFIDVHHVSFHPSHCQLVSEVSVFNLNSHLRAESSLISSHVVPFQRILSPTTHHCWPLTNFIVSSIFSFSHFHSSCSSPTSCWWNHHWSLTMFCYFIFITKMACWNARDLQPNLLSRWFFHWTLVDFQDLICSRVSMKSTITKLMFHQSICIQAGERKKNGKSLGFVVYICDNRMILILLQYHE